MDITVIKQLYENDKKSLA